MQNLHQSSFEVPEERPLDFPNIPRKRNPETGETGYEYPRFAIVNLKAESEDQARILLKEAAREFPEARILISSGIGTANASGESTGHVNNVSDWLFGLNNAWLGHLDIEKQPGGTFKLTWPGAIPPEAHVLIMKVAEKFGWE
jgi:hypothetical protein